MKNSIKNSNTTEIIDGIISTGASTAAVFPVSEIRFDLRFRDMCKQNLCGGYGKNYMCPPLNGEPEKLIDDAKSYEHAILIQTIYPLEDSYDIEGMGAGNDLHSKNIIKVRDYINDNIEYNRLLILGAGECKLCKKCGALDGIPCRHPGETISSIEGYCMDVADMTNSHGLKYINGKDTVSYAAVFLLD